MNNEITNYASTHSGMIKSVFLLLLVVFGNFTAETLSCDIQSKLIDNMAIKYLIIFMIIYFTLNITSSNTPHPIDVAKKTVIIWITYIIFTHMTIGFTLTGLVLLMIFYILTNLIDYEKGQLVNLENQTIIKNDNIMLYEKGQHITFFIFVCILLIGFIINMVEKRKEYGSEFNISTFILDMPMCKNK